MTKLVMLETKIDWVLEAVHKTTGERALAIEREAVIVHVPVAIETDEGKVIRTPAPIPKGLFICKLKVYVVVADTVELSTERLAAAKVFGLTVNDAVL